MPPKEPLIYRLFEIVQNYGYAYKAVLNEKFGDGIMSAISFSTKVEKETDKDGNNWAVITLRGKWYVSRNSFMSRASLLANVESGYHILGSKQPCQMYNERNIVYIQNLTALLFLHGELCITNSRNPQISLLLSVPFNHYCMVR